MWKFNFGIHQAKIDQAKAERLKIKANEILAQTYLPLEVAQAYLAVQKTKKQIAATKKAFQNARRWFLAASSNYDWAWWSPRRSTTPCSSTPPRRPGI